MPRDICAVTEDISPGCLTACDYDALVRRLDGYDEGGNLFRDHAYQQRARRKRVAVKIGRYISSDPIGIDGGLNTFNYANVNPVMQIDPMGLDSYQQCVANATATGAAGGALLGACAALITPGGQPFIGPAIGYGGEFGAYAGALTGMATCSESSGDDDKPKQVPRTIPVPDTPRKGCTCTCRADADNTVEGNIQPGDQTFAFGTATAHSCEAASKEAKRIATHALGKKPKHIPCKCSER